MKGTRRIPGLILAGLVMIAALGIGLHAQDQTYPQTPVQNPPNSTEQKTPVQNAPNTTNTPVYNYPNQSSASGQYGVIPAGTTISIRTDNEIKAEQPQVGMTYPARISEDVIGQNGAVLIPRNSPAQIAVVDTGQGTGGKSDMALAVQSVTLNGQTRMLQTNAVQGENDRGLGANKRTGKYVGGGALVGTLLGAIAGGGKGAAIGAAIGAAGGAGAQVLTRGDHINVPAETVLTFKLDQPVTLQ
ncbi:MAG TPA: hypothetical protein VN622_12790 [Clostridia bacterium]|nr:hypothetical protein [Clostridia bacterium]